MRPGGARRSVGLLVLVAGLADGLDAGTHLATSGADGLGELQGRLLAGRGGGGGCHCVVMRCKVEREVLSEVKCEE